MLLFRVNKRHRLSVIVLLVCVCVFLSVGGNYFLTSPRQFELENHALALNKQSLFNPRSLTYSVAKYLNAFNNDDANGLHDSVVGGSLSPGIVFHWDDWVDMHPGNNILNKYRAKFPEGQCDRKLEKVASVSGYYLEPYETKVKRGMANLYCSKDIPKLVWITTDKAYVEVPVKSKKRVATTVSSVHREVSKEELVSEVNRLGTGDRQKFRSREFVPMKKQLDIKAEDFYFDPNLEIMKLRQLLRADTIDSEQREYLKFLEYANVLVDHTEKYFKYPWITSDLVNGHAHHLAYPFFKRFIGDRERQSVIQHLVRAWFQFAESVGVASWINYGSLLGWAYNGVNMPWDTDVDIQVPIAHLSKLGREFNQTLIVENPRFGNGKYLLEVAPTYVRQGNSKNFIDARFIEVNSGLYIDISALSHTDYTPPKDLLEGFSEEQKAVAIPVNCKNWNWHTLGELLPLRHTYFEGGDAYIPQNISRLLSRKYGATSYTTKLHFKNHNYQQDIHMWVPDEICPGSPKFNRFEGDDHSKLSLAGACNDLSLQDEYRINYEPAKRHLELQEDVDTTVDYDVEETGPLPYFRKDAWEYYEDMNQGRAFNDLWYVREEVKTCTL